MDRFTMTAAYYYYGFAYAYGKAYFCCRCKTETAVRSFFSKGAGYGPDSMTAAGSFFLLKT